MNIYLIRHSAVYNPNKLCYGQSEIPLEENFTQDFDWIENELDSILKHNTLFYSSPLRRCTKMATYISKENYQIDNRIKELDFGDWELIAWDKINTKDLNNWMADFVNFKVPNGENFIDLTNRCKNFWEDVKEKSTFENLVIFTHSGVIRSILSDILDIPLNKVFDLQIDYSSITKITYQKEYNKQTVKYINRTL
jgi:alpha-ribazole phosphatase